jgi:hypothetical protein
LFLLFSLLTHYQQATGSDCDFSVVNLFNELEAAVDNKETAAALKFFFFGSKGGKTKDAFPSFKSLQESDWVEDHHRKRLARASKFDLKPSPDQVSAPDQTLDPAAIAAAAVAVAAVYTDTLALPQQMHAVGDVLTYHMDAVDEEEAAAALNIFAFKSLQEESDWVENRRRKHLASGSEFGLKPSPDQVSAPVQTVDPAAIAIAAAVAAIYTDTPALPPQTHPARRLFVGNLPPRINKHQIRRAFKEAINITLPHLIKTEDRIFTVYFKGRFCFLEFESEEMCSACLVLDGLEVMPGQPPVKVQRPHDYNLASAPPQTNKPVLELSKLGTVSPTVLYYGPNKIFIGGLHYHLQEKQVLKLLQAFSKVKAFRLVKNIFDTALNRGFCFVEFADPAVTPEAIARLNGIYIGGGKSLTAQLAGGGRGGGSVMPSAAPAAPPSALIPRGGNKRKHPYA